MRKESAERLLERSLRAGLSAIEASPLPAKQATMAKQLITKTAADAGFPTVEWDDSKNQVTFSHSDGSEPLTFSLNPVKLMRPETTPP